MDEAMLKTVRDKIGEAVPEIWARPPRIVGGIKREGIAKPVRKHQALLALSPSERFSSVVIGGRVRDDGRLYWDPRKNALITQSPVTVTRLEDRLEKTKRPEATRGRYALEEIALKPVKLR